MQYRFFVGVLFALAAACLVAFAGPGLAVTGSATVKTRHGKLGTYLVVGKAARALPLLRAPLPRASRTFSDRRLRLDPLGLEDLAARPYLSLE